MWWCPKGRSPLSFLCLRCTFKENVKYNFGFFNESKKKKPEGRKEIQLGWDTEGSREGKRSLETK